MQLACQHLKKQEIYFKDRHDNDLFLQDIALERSEIILELHCNAFNGETHINRSEILILPQHKDYASKLQENFEKFTNFKCNIIALNAGHRGCENLTQIESLGKIGIIVEPMFFDTPNNLHNFIFTNQKEYAAMLKDSF